MNRLCIFDFDGTLADSIDVGLAIYNGIAHKYGSLPIDKSEFPSLRKAGYVQVMREKNIKWWAVPKMVRELTGAMKERVDEVPVYPGIITAVKVIQDAGIDIGILTSNDEATVRAFLKRHNFPDFAFLTSEKMLFGKHKALRNVLARYRLAPDQAVYVGDEPRDVEACRKVGVPVVGVTWGVAGTVGFATAPPDTLIDAPAALAPAVQGLLAGRQ